MITSERQLEQALDQMGRMCRALSTLCAEILPQSRPQFALMAEGPLEEIRRLEEEVRAYLDQTPPMPENVAAASENEPSVK